MKKFLPIVWILSRFFIIYIILVFLYQEYLNYYNVTLNTCDPFTDLMSYQSKYLLDWAGYKTDIIQVRGKPYNWLYFNNQYVSKVTEGCNAISVMILFMSFILGFYKGFKKTFIFICIGLLVIHFSNIFRGSFISWVYYKFPVYSHITHDYIFPVIIYAVVVFLWYYWMKFMVLKDERKN